jgi:hypothetical protein
MFYKLLSLVLCLSLTLAPVCFAEEPIPKGKITGLMKGQKAPYSGVLLDNVSAARIFTDKKYFEDQWKLKLEYELGKERAKLNLKIETQKASLDALQEKHTTLINLKDKEIERLTEIAAGKEDYSTWWAVGGVLAGIGLTLAVVFAVDAGVNK